MDRLYHKVLTKLKTGKKLLWELQLKIMNLHISAYELIDGFLLWSFYWKSDGDMQLLFESTTTLGIIQ